MTGDELKGSIELLHTNQTQLARLFQVDVRTVRRWIANEIRIPYTVELWIRYMKQHALTPERVVYDINRFGNMAWLLMDDAPKDKPIALKIPDHSRPVVGQWDRTLGKWLYDWGGTEIEARNPIGWSPVPI